MNHRSVLVGLAAAALVVTGLGPAQATSDKPPITLPKNPKGLTAPVTLPTALDPAAPYQPQVSCSPVDMPGATKLQALVMKTYKVGGKGAIHHGCTEGLSEHSEGRAWDWMVAVKTPKEKAAAADFISWATKDHGRNARRLGIMYIIYDQKIWGIYREADGWRPSYDHVDHVHVSLSWNGARGDVSFWTGKVAAVDKGPCVAFTGTPGILRSSPRTGACAATSGLLKKVSDGQREYASTGATVKKAQKALGVKQTSTFDATTWSAVKAYQRAHDLPVNGVLDAPTWASLVPGDVTSDVADDVTAAQAAAYGLAHYASTPVRASANGRPPLWLHIALGLPVATQNGHVGSITLAAVKALQAAHDLPVTGVVGRAEWQALVDDTTAASSTDDPQA